MKHTLLFGAITSIFAINVAMADTVVTSKTYVDGRDALKVDIAQGTGDNNANVGKTLVVNSSGNLELGTPAAGNYVEDSITDGVTNKAPSENAVHDALANKQDTIDTGLVSLGDEWIEDLPAVVSYDTTSGLVGNKYGILDYDGSVDYVDDGWNNYQEDSETNHLIPTVGAVGRELQTIWDNMPSPITWDSNDTTAVNNYSTSFTGTGNWPSAHENKYVTGSSLAQGLALKQKILPANNSTNNPNGSLVTYGLAGRPGSKKIVTTVASGGTDIPTDGAVYTAISGKQDTITTAEVDMNGLDLPALISYDTTNGLVGNRIGVLDQEAIEHDEGALHLYDVYGVEMDNYVPTVRAVAQSVSRMPNVDNGFNTPISNYSTTFDDTPGNWPNSAGDKLPDGVLFAKGLALKQNRQIGASPVGNANSTDAGKILVVGNDGKIAMSTATNPNNFQTKIPAQATKIESTDSTYAPSVVTNGTTDGSVGQMAILTSARVGGDDGADGNEFADYTNADNLIPTAAAVGAELGYKQAKKVCAGWPDGAEHTDANCWLWNMPD